MKRLFSIILLTGLLFQFSLNVHAQYFSQQFTGALTTGNLGGGTVISNVSVTADPIYVNDPASATQFTFLSTNNDLASIEISGDGVMRMVRQGSGTVYIVRNTNFTGSPTSVMVSLDFNAEVTAGTSGGALEFMVGQNFANSNNNPSATDKHSVFFVNTKNPTGTPGTWGVTPVSASSTSAFTTTETITWYVNNSGASIEYTGPDASTNSIANDTYDLWVGDSLYYDDQAANSADANLNNFEIRIAGGNGTYTVDNINISEIPTGGGTPTLTDHFRTKQSGNWNAISTWEFSVDGNTWIDATVTPYDTSNTITIQTGDTVTVTESVTVDQVTVESNAAVVVEGDPVVLTISDGADPVDMQVNGTLKVTGVAMVSPGPYSINLNEGAGLSFGDGSIYEHNQNGGSLPVSIWEEGSTLYVNAVTNAMPGNRNQSFYNIVWDCPGQTGNYNMGFDEVTIGGDITLVNTGLGRWYLCGPSSLDTATVTVTGNITLIEGQFAAHGTGNAGTVIEVHVLGNITALSGNFSVTRGSQGGTGTTDFYLHGDLFTLTNVTSQNSNSAGAKFIFAGTSPQTLTLSNVSFGGGGCPVEIAPGSTLNVGTSQFGGSGIFTVTDGATLGCGNEGGLDSTLQNTGTISLSTAGNYIFNGMAAQVTGSMLPATVNDLTVNNSANVTLTQNVQVNGNLNILDGDLILDGNTITLGAGAMLNETAGNTVTGLTGKIVTTADLNSPAGVNVGGLGAMLTSSSNLGSTLVERIHSAGTGLGNEGIFRQFNIVPTNNTGLNASLRFYYDESELNSITEANLTMFKSPTGANNTWNGVGGTVNASENYVELTGINDFSFWTLGDIGAPLPVELVSFTAFADAGKIKLDWTTASEINNQGWEVERKSANTEETNWVKLGFVDGKGNSTQSVSYSFIDGEVGFGVYNYRLKQIDFDGTTSYSNTIEIDLGIGPVEFALNQNYPNPFNPSTIISFDIPQSEFVNLSIYNILGEKVATLINAQMEQGRYNHTFNASAFTSGVYVYRLTAGNVVLTKKMMLTK